MIAGGMPSGVQVLGTIGPSGVDRTAMATLQFSGDMIAHAACSFDAALHRQALIVGDDGVIETSYANHTDLAPPVLLLRRGRDRRDAPELIAVPAINGFRAEAEAFALHVNGAAWTGISRQESIDVASMLATLRQLLGDSASMGRVGM
jgi:predicted dehydrogenase